MTFIDEAVLISQPSRWRLWLSRHFADLAIATILIFLASVYFYPHMIVSIYPGEAGVVWDRFTGTRTDVIYGEGVHIIAPWNILYKYDVRLQQDTNQYTALSKSGLPVAITVSVRYRLAGAPFEAPVNRGESARNSLPELQRRVGPDYQEKIVTPLVSSVVREVLGQYTADELYRLHRQEIQDEIVRLIADRRNKEEFADERYVDVIDVLIRDVTLPPIVRDAIEKKMAQEQSMLAFDFTLRLAQKEAERKAIEAEGIRRFQHIVSKGITPSYLQWKGIEATLDLARSQNSKVVIIGGKDGLPLILNTNPDEPLKSLPTPKR